MQLPSDELSEHLACLTQANEASLVALPSFVLSKPTWDHLCRQLVDQISGFHAQYPLRIGPARETVRSQLDLEERLFDETVARLAEVGQLEEAQARLRLVSHRVGLTSEEEDQVEAMLDAIKAAGFEAPTRNELLGSGYFPELINWLVETGRVHQVGGDLLYADETLQQVRDVVAEFVRKHGSIEVRDLRDLLQTSRKYALPLLEYMDQIHYTRRVGDKRILV